MRLIRKPRAKKKRQALKLPAWSKEFTPAVLHVNREFGIKAKPEATIALLLRLGFNKGQVKKALQAVQGEMGESGRHTAARPETTSRGVDSSTL